MEPHAQHIVDAILEKGGDTLACTLRDALNEHLKVCLSDWDLDPKDTEGTTWIRTRLSDNRKVGFVYKRGDSYVPDTLSNRSYMGGHPSLKQAQRHAEERLRTLGYLIRE